MPLRTRHELRDLTSSHHQFYAVDADLEWVDDLDAVLAAFRAESVCDPPVFARPRFVWIGIASYFLSTPLVVEVWDGAPPIPEDADHVVDASLTLSQGHLAFGWDDFAALPETLEPGDWRLRIVGRDLALGDDPEGGDRWTLMLWRAPAAPVTVHRDGARRQD